MTRKQALTLLTQLKPELIERFGVARLALFGSTARNEATGDSDIDILVEFKGRANSDSYFGLQFFLEDHLGVRVDLVTEKALRKELRPFIEREALNV